MFDIDGVIRDVSKSYRFAIKETVNCLSGWEPKTEDIDNLKATGSWNNDWDLSHELIRQAQQQKKEGDQKVPSRKKIIEVFNNFYFGCNPINSSIKKWTGFINNETLLVDKNFFTGLMQKGIVYGFVSGAELPSARFVL